MDFREPRRRRRWRGRLKFDFHPVSGDAVVEEDVEVHLAVRACVAASRVLLLLFPCGPSAAFVVFRAFLLAEPCVACPADLGASRLVFSRQNDARARRFALGGKALDFITRQTRIYEPRTPWMRDMRQ